MIVDKIKFDDEDLVKEKILIGICLSERGGLPLQFVQSLITLLPAEVFWVTGTMIEENRNKIWNYAVKNNFDYIMMIDSDQVFDIHHFNLLKETMLKTKADIVTGIYFQQKTPEKDFDSSVIFGKFNENGFGNYEMIKDIPMEPFKIGACGMGFCLIKKTVFGMKEPFWRLKLGNAYFAEDISFCHRAVKNGFNIICDPRVVIGHLRLVDITPDKYKSI